MRIVAVFTFHLAKTRLLTTLRALWRPPTPERVAGLEHAECMTVMTLGAPIFSPTRLQLKRFAMFASWSSEDAIDDFLAKTPLGHELAVGWHVRLAFLRRWGHLAAFPDLPAKTGEQDPEAPVVAVTIARMRMFEVPRFIRWGKPVETLVRDHPGATLALAAMRLPRTVSTFSVWRSAREMTDMVHGRSAVARPERHAVAMVERTRRDFHFEFTTLRFQALSEHGAWDGRRAIVPPR